MVCVKCCFCIEIVCDLLFCYWYTWYIVATDTPNEYNAIYLSDTFRICYGWVRLCKST